MAPQPSTHTHQSVREGGGGQSEVTQNRHPKTRCPKHPPIKPTPKQPPNQHPKPPNT